MTLLEYQCLSAKIPVPVREYAFAKPRRWRFDYCWPDQKVALEQEGGIWTRGRHTRGKGYTNDLEKYSEAAIRGWCVIRCTPEQVQNGSAFALVQRAFQERRSA